MIMGDNKPHKASARDGKIYRLVVVSFGLLCILQAALNISLRLALYPRTPDFEATIKNLTEEVNELKRNANQFANYSKEGWVYFNNSFYYISSIKKSWQESRAYCLQRGADLVIINSEKENEFTRKFQRLTWIGLTDTDTEGIWKWVDGTLLNISYWHTGEPNNYQGRDEDCGEIRIYHKLNSWNDGPCDTQNFWICEKMVCLHPSNENDRTDN